MSNSNHPHAHPPAHPHTLKSKPENEVATPAAFDMEAYLRHQMAWLDEKRAQLNSVFHQRVQPMKNILNNHMHLLRQNRGALSPDVAVRTARTITQRYNQATEQERNKLEQSMKKLEEHARAVRSELESMRTRRALLIGINYIGTSSQLNGCIEDVNQMHAFLTTRGFQNPNIRRLTDLEAEKPTKANIMKALREELQKCEAGDLFFLHYSGHGASTRDTSGDELDGRDEYLYTLDGKALMDDELNAIFQQCMRDGVKVIALFDCCHSGTMLDLKYNYMVPNRVGSWYNRADVQKTEKDVINGKVNACRGRVYALSGCMDDQTSAEALILQDGSGVPTRKVQGAMTYTFLKEMRERDGKEPIGWRQLMQHIRDHLYSNGYVQIPQFSTNTDECLNEFVVF